MVTFAEAFVVVDVEITGVVVVVDVVCVVVVVVVVVVIGCAVASVGATVV